MSSVERKMARILLINAAGNYTFPNIVNPPLGLMYLASALRKRNGHQIKILDMRPDCLGQSDVIEEIARFRPEIVGISALSPEANILHSLSKEIKKAGDCKIIVGGPHAISYPDDCLNDPHIDYVVLGEGENTMPELVEILSRGGDASRVRGIAFRLDMDVVLTSPREYIQNLDELAFPAWDLIDIRKYWKCWRPNPLQNHQPYMAIITSRGCVFECTYCNQVMGRTFRARSPENVFEEIETLYGDYGIRDFEIRDSCFNTDKKRALKICDLIIHSGLKISLSFSNGLRGDLIDDELLMKLREAGTNQISYAIETASQRIQKLVKKSLDLDKIEKVIEKTADCGIVTYGFFMIGFPTETKREIEETVKLALKLKLDMACFFIVNPFPASELYRQAKMVYKHDAIDFSKFSYMYADFNLSEVSDKELLGYQRKLYRSFYMNSRRMIKLLWKMPNKFIMLSYVLLLWVKLFASRSRKCHGFLYKIRPLSWGLKY